MCFRKFNMQISAAITEKYKYGQYHRSRNKNGTYTHVFRVNKDNKTMLGVIWCVSVKIVCKLVPSLLKKWFYL